MFGRGLVGAVEQWRERGDHAGIRGLARSEFDALPDQRRGQLALRARPARRCVAGVGQRVGAEPERLIVLGEIDFLAERELRLQRVAAQFAIARVFVVEREIVFPVLALRQFGQIGFAQDRRRQRIGPRLEKGRGFVGFDVLDAALHRGEAEIRIERIRLQARGELGPAAGRIALGQLPHGWELFALAHEFGAVGDGGRGNRDQAGQGEKTDGEGRSANHVQRNQEMSSMCFGTAQ